jgi:hypothetical protein
MAIRTFHIFANIKAGFVGHDGACCGLTVPFCFSSPRARLVTYRRLWIGSSVLASLTHV